MISHMGTEHDITISNLDLVDTDRSERYCKEYYHILKDF